VPSCPALAYPSGGAIFGDLTAVRKMKFARKIIRR
jgi:hypothetical protein